MRLLKLLDYRNVEAYFVRVRSKNLQNKLYEIVISDPDVLYEINTLSMRYGGMDADDLILHSKNPTILMQLKEEGVFLDEKKKSLTDGYINQKY